MIETENATSKGERSVLCEELEEEKYDRNNTLWKLVMIPAEDILIVKPEKSRNISQWAVFEKPRHNI